MLRDLWRQAYEAMVYNRRRTSITMVGMAWGIATVVLLLAYGSGFGRAIEAIFAQWGTQLIGVFPGRTSEQVGGSKAGVQVRFTQEDVDRLEQTVPGLKHVTPMLSKDVPVANELHTYTWTVNGYRPVVQEILVLDVSYWALFYRRRRREPRSRGGDRLGGKDQAVWRTVSDRPAYSAERHQLRGHRRSSAEDAGGRAITSIARSTSRSAP